MSAPGAVAASPPQVGPQRTMSLGRGLAAALLAGIAAVAAAAVVGVIIACILVATGHTTTGVWRLACWLTAGGMLGGWQQEVSSSFGRQFGWHITASFAPLWVTAAAWFVIARACRRVAVGAPVGALGAAVGAVIGMAILAGTSNVSQNQVDGQGEVATHEGATLLWTQGPHPGSLVGAALLVVIAWILHTSARDWWRAGRGTAVALLVAPGVVLTIGLAVAVWYLTSTPSLAVAALLLAPLLGSLAVLALGGTPVEVGLTRVLPEVTGGSSWSAGWLVALAGIVLLVLYCVIIGWLLGRRGKPGRWGPTIGVTACCGAFLAWSQQALVSVPSGLGAPTVLAANWLVSAVVAALMAGVVTLIRNRVATRRNERAAAATRPGVSR